MNEKAEAMKYGDVFSVSGELADKPITPKDAATLQSAENLSLGEITEGGISSVDKRQRHGLVRHDDTPNAGREGGAVIAGHRLIAETIGEELLGRFAQPKDLNKGDEGYGELTESPN